MEENYTFNQENQENLTESVQSEFTEVKFSEVKQEKPKKKGTFKKFLTGLLSMVLVPSLFGFGAGASNYKLLTHYDRKNS